MTIEANLLLPTRPIASLDEYLGHLDALASTDESAPDVEIIGQRLRSVTDQNRCFLGEEEQRVISSLLRRFPEDFTPEVIAVGAQETLLIPKIVDIRDGVAHYDEAQPRQQPDWTYTPVDLRTGLR